MIQFNLLPDVKLEYIKARRTKYLVVLASTVLTGVMVAVVVVLFLGVNVVQKRHLSNLANDIESKSDQLKNEEDIDKILTVQNQLNSLNGLHDSKPAADRIGDYLSQITPNDVTVSELTVDFSANTMSFDGSAKTLKNVNEFIDTMKFTTFDMDDTSKPAFSAVVMSNFNRSDTGNNAAVTYQISLNFDPAIFDITKDVKLKVPNTITTRSIIERPDPLFQQQTEGGQ